MGCTASKLDNEETVRRCKDRRRLIKDAVLARHHLAAAHSDYCRSLRLTASALCTFASGEPLAVSDTTPSVFLHTATPKSSPPPPQKPQPQPSSTTTTLPTILTRRRKPPPKLPHILSESSSPKSQFSNPFFPTAQQHKTYSTYSTSPSQASSVWNWDNFYPPPSPPGSEYFRAKQQNRNNNPRNQTPNSEDDDSSSEIIESESEYNYFHSEEPNNNHKITQKTNSKTQHEGFESERSECEAFGAKPKPEPECEPETEREEVHCSEWGDHYSTTSSSEEEDVREDSVAGGGAPPPEAARVEEKSGGDGIRMEVKTKVVLRHKDLKEIVEAIRENFEKAAVAGDRLSEMLEISKEQLDRSFKRLRKTVYHSNSLLSSLSASWTSKPPLAVKYRFDTGSLDGPGGSKSLCSTLERLLAWEKKLYQEVKAREGVKIEHEKKLAALQSQECKGGDEAKIDKTKASITRLQSLIIVTSQAVSTTSNAINGLRDSDLVPQLVELCHGD